MMDLECTAPSDDEAAIPSSPRVHHGPEQQAEEDPADMDVEWSARDDPVQSNVPDARESSASPTGVEEPALQCGTCLEETGTVSAAATMTPEDVLVVCMDVLGQAEQSCRREITRSLESEWHWLNRFFWTGLSDAVRMEAERPAPNVASPTFGGAGDRHTPCWNDRPLSRCPWWLRIRSTTIPTTSATKARSTCTSRDIPWWTGCSPVESPLGPNSPMVLWGQPYVPQCPVAERQPPVKPVEEPVRNTTEHRHRGEPRRRSRSRGREGGHRDRQPRDHGLALVKTTHV